MVTHAPAQTKGIATFGQLKNLEFVQNFYDGGTGSLGSGPGKDLHLQFTDNAQVIVSASKGGSGNFINNPGGYPVLFFQTGNDVVINAADMVSVGLWFTYSALQQGTATVYGGPNGTGTVLATITLNPNNSGCTGYKMCVWSPVAVPLPTTPAGSIRFAGTANFLAIGAIHLGVKIPTTTALVSSLNPSVQGQQVTFTATVTATGAVPVGTVKFKAGNKVLGEVPIVSGTASLSTSSLPVGTTKISAIFRGTGFVGTQATLIQQVN
jgi:hypothetical protein